MTQPHYDLNDLQSDLGHLHHLIDTIADHILTDCKFVVDDVRLPGMDRLNALIWIARDLSKTIDTSAETHFQEIGSTTSGNQALAERVVKYLADPTIGKPVTQESLLAQGMESDAELLGMALEVLGK